MDKHDRSTFVIRVDIQVSCSPRLTLVCLQIILFLLNAADVVSRLAQ